MYESRFPTGNILANNLIEFIESDFTFFSNSFRRSKRFLLAKFDEFVVFEGAAELLEDSGEGRDF